MKIAFLEDKYCWKKFEYVIYLLVMPSLVRLGQVNQIRQKFGLGPISLG